MNFLRKLKKRERIGLLIALLIVLATLTDRLVVQNVRASLARLDNEIAQKTLELGRLRAVEADIPKVVEEFHRYRPFARGLGSDEQEIATMLEAIGLAAKNSKVVINTSRRDPVRAGGFVEYSVEVTGEGEVAAIVGFLAGLHEAPATMRPRRFDVRLRNPNTTELRVSLMVVRKVLEGEQELLSRVSSSR